jgi:hypothetical protein
VSDLETGWNLDNSARQSLSGGKLWWRVLLRAGSGLEMVGYHRDSAFPACPACGSPNVMVTASRRGQSYLCLELDCKSAGSCEVKGSNGVERRKARVRMYVFLVAFLVLLLALFLTGHLPNS